jgi:natural product biosynthesis luciferase-like monooxygenase protein
MRFGQLHLFERPAGRTSQEIISEQMDFMVRAEDYGFDSVWPAEHHFREYGHCPTPALTLAAIANRTKKIRLGTGVVVLPLNHPVRVAEDYAFIDILSNGRVDLGIGRGYQPHEYAGYGVDQSRSKDIFRESVEVLQQCWTKESFSYDGEFYKFQDLSMFPRPLQQPHPPVWMASVSEESFAMCGRYGFNLLCSPIFGFNVQTGANQIEQYRQALRNNGRDPKDFGIGAVSLTYVADTTEQAMSEFEDGVMWYMKTFQKYVSTPKGTPTIQGYELYAQIRDLLDLAQWELLIKAGAVVCGSPDQVVDQIGAMSDQCGFTEYLAWTRVGGLAADRVDHSMELMASKVIPQLRNMGAVVK